VGQYSDIAATSPEGINLDVVGYDLVNGAQGGGATRAAVSDFNNDGHLDYVLHTPARAKQAIWYLTTIFISAAPTVQLLWLVGH